MIIKEKVNYIKYCSSCGDKADNLSSYRIGAAFQSSSSHIIGGILLSLCNGCKKQLTNILKDNETSINSDENFALEFPVAKGLRFK